MEHDDDPNARRRALIGLVVIVGLVIGVLFVMRQIRQSAELQDCVIAGRTNCAPIR